MLEYKKQRGGKEKEKNIWIEMINNLNKGEVCKCDEWIFKRNGGEISGKS